MCVFQLRVRIRGEKKSIIGVYLKKNTKQPYIPYMIKKKKKTFIKGIIFAKGFITSIQQKRIYVCR